MQWAQEIQMKNRSKNEFMKLPDCTETQEIDDHKSYTSFNEYEMDSYVRNGASEHFNKLHSEWKQSDEGKKKIEDSGDVMIKADKLVRRLQ